MNLLKHGVMDPETFRRLQLVLTSHIKLGKRLIILGWDLFRLFALAEFSVFDFNHTASSLWLVYCNLFCFFRLIRQFYYHSISAVFQWIPDYSLQLVNLCYLSPCSNNLALPIGMFCRFIDYVPVPAMSRFSQYQSFCSKIYSFSLKYIK